MINIVRATNASIIYKEVPLSHSPPDEPCPEISAVPGTLNCVNWAKKMTIASPFTKPNITGWGTKRINFPHCIRPANICRIPIKTTVANKYSTPCSATSATMTTAKAPVAPEIIPGRPPKTAVTNPTRKAAYSPTKGCTPATKANATASGIRAKATVSPDKSSVLTLATVKPSSFIKFKSSLFKVAKVFRMVCFIYVFSN